MSSTASKPLALVPGGTGRTGSSIVAGLLKRGIFRVAIITRPSSTSKPAVIALKEQGVEIREADIAKDDLVPILAGVDVLISAVSFEALQDQRRLFAAAKEQPVPPRVIPCDYGTYTPPGVRAMADEKYELHAYVESLGLPHTYIDVGWWMQMALPHRQSEPSTYFRQYSWEFNAGGETKNALTSLSDIGHFVARIVEDPRTLNKYVFVWVEERTQREVWDIAKRVAGEDFDAVKIEMSPEVLRKRAIENKEIFRKTGDQLTHIIYGSTEYAYSMYHRGDNTIANAKAAGALDAKELYPDVPTTTLEEAAKEFYAQPWSYVE